MSDPFWLGVATGAGATAGLLILGNIVTIIRGFGLHSSDCDSMLASQSAVLGVITAAASIAGAVFA